MVEFINGGWLDAPDSVAIRGYNLGLAAYVMRDFAFGEGPFSIAVGYGFSSHNIHSDSEFVNDTINGSVHSVLRPLHAGSDVEKNKISCNYLEVPIELRLVTGKKKRRQAWEPGTEVERELPPQFKLAVGGRIGYAINVHTKTIDANGKRKLYGVEQLEPLRYGLTARIGFGMFGLSGFYALTPLIQTGKGTQVIPYHIGLTILLL